MLNEDEDQVSVVSSTQDHGARERQPVAAPTLQLDGQRIAGAELRGIRESARSASEQAAAQSVNLPRGRRHQVGCKSCPCMTCRISKARARQELARRQRRGYPAWGDIDAVRNHIRTLTGYGMSEFVISELSGVSLVAVASALGRISTERMTFRVEQALLAVTFDVRAIAKLRPQATVDSSGARRRLQALIVAGWTVQDLAERAGLERQHFRRFLYMERYSAQRCVEVMNLFARLWLTELPKLTSRAEARRQAMLKRYRWVGIGAWDDDTIDDPAAKPNVGGSRDFPVDMVKVRRALEGDAKFTTLNTPERIELARQWVELEYSKTAFEKRFAVSGRTSGKYFDLAAPHYQRKSA